jgi:hypothetical protein
MLRRPLILALVMVSVSEGQVLRRRSSQGRRFHRPKRQSIAKFYRRLDVTATAFAFLPGAVFGCFRNPEGANSRQEPI